MDTKTMPETGAPATSSALRVLVVDDSDLDRLFTVRLVEREGLQAQCAADGEEALEILRGPEPPAIVLLDWQMPGLDGPTICRLLRRRSGTYVYVILVSARAEGRDQIEGREAGADDYIVKPFHPAELRAKLGVARRIVSLERSLRQRVRELEAALAHVRELEALLPICMWCKRIREDDGTWTSLESHITRRTGSLFSHGLCESCRDQHYPEGA